MKIFYHNDPDGIAAANVVGRKYQSEGIPINKEDYIEMDYNKEFPLNIIKPYEEVFIVDYSIKPNIMKKLIDKLNGNYNLIHWIDHHKSAIEEYNNTEIVEEESINGIRYSGISGCMLTQLYLYGSQKLIDRVILQYNVDVDSIIKDIEKFSPQYITYINDWDVFRLNYIETIPFIYAFNSYDIKPYENYKFNMIESSIDNFINEGKIIKRYVDFKNNQNIKNNGFEVNNFIGKYKIFALNTTEKSSLVFDSLENKKDYDFVCVFNFNNKLYNYSFYSLGNDKIDCSEIAKQFGGGGHKGAAGCCTKENIFKNE